MPNTNGIFLIDNQNKILLVHATSGRWNQWSVPKGLSELNEISLESAIRELKEETNIEVDYLIIDTKYEYEYLGIQKYKSGKKTIEGHLYKIDSNLSEQNLDLKCESMIPNTNTPECDKFLWIQLDTGMKMMHEAQSELLKKYLNK